MKRSDRYYCVGCGKIEELDKAQLLFRTGFFRVVYPLGCCTNCCKAKTDGGHLSDNDQRDEPAAGKHCPDLPDKCTIYREELHVNSALDDASNVTVTF